MNRSTVLASALEYFNRNELQANIWVDKYCLRDKQGNYLEATPIDMFHRIANEFARIEAKYKNPMSAEEIFNLLLDFKYVIPGGSMLFGIGNDHFNTSLGNCFVIGDSTDSYGSILKIDEEQAQLMKRRGGVGHDLSHLRPAGSRVNNAAITSTGAVSFMGRYSNTTREVAQGGRRGALMLTMDINHPDAAEFVTAKADTTKLTGCNISVKIDDDFMRSVKANDDEAVAKLWKQIVHQAWATAEPGVLFWDTIVRNSPADRYIEFTSTSTNPCGEIPLCPYDTCRLMSINLFSFVNNPFTPQAKFDEVKFVDVVSRAQRLMDDCIDLEAEKIDKILEAIQTQGEDPDTCFREVSLWIKIKDKLIKGRRTGLSVIGLADTLAALGLKYGSDDSIKQLRYIFTLFEINSQGSSRVLAEERGAFPIWDKEIDPEKRRNIAIRTIPPSGTLSILAGVTSGIEPVYKLEYTRRRKVEKSDNVAYVDKQGDKWEEYTVYHPLYEKYGKPESYLGATAYDISPKDRVRLQAEVQKFIDHSISSTINLPKDITEEAVSEIYMLAWELGCKGVTVYREGCRDGVLIDKKTEVKEKFTQHDAPKRPAELKCRAHKVTLKGASYSVIVGLYEERPYEVFAVPYYHLLGNDKVYTVVKEGTGSYYITNSKLGLRADSFRIPLIEDLNDEQRAITRLVSTSLRHGADIKFIVEQLNKTEGDLTSFNKAIARVLKLYVADGESLKGSKCETCGDDLVMENGCEVCKSCGFSKCG